MNLSSTSHYTIRSPMGKKRSQTCTLVKSGDIEKNIRGEMAVYSVE